MEQAYQFLLDILNKNEAIIVGVSGGPDSMALLKLAIQAREAKNIKIIVAHVNHNSGRKGQIDDEKFVREFCLKNNLIFEVMTIDNYSTDNFHNQAHNKRYEYFENLVKKYKAKYLLTAHHADDLMESILMRISRGSTLKGYSGFSKIVNMPNYKIVRPLINVTKDEILEFNKKNNITFQIDSSNTKDVYTRNRYRKYIVPKLKEEEEDVHKKFNKFSNTLLEYNDYVDKQVMKVFNKIFSNEILYIDKLKKEDKLIQKKIIEKILELKYQNELSEIYDNHIDLIFDLISSKKKNTYIDLPLNIKVIKEYNEITFVSDVWVTEYQLELKKKTKLPNNQVIEILKETDENSNYICRLNKKDITLPLYVRNKKDGDKMMVKGLNGSKKISDIFINEKVSLRERLNYPVVVDATDKIVWLPGLKKSNYDVSKNEKCDIILKYHSKGGTL